MVGSNSASYDRGSPSRGSMRRRSGSTVVARHVIVTPTRVDRSDDHRVIDVAAAIEASVDADVAPDADLVGSWYRTAERILAEELPAGLLSVRMGAD